MCRRRLVHDHHLPRFRADLARDGLRAGELTLAFRYDESVFGGVDNAERNECKWQ